MILNIDLPKLSNVSATSSVSLPTVASKVVSNDGAYRIEGAAWGQPIGKAEVRIDDGPWQEAMLDTEIVRRFSWRCWTLDWKDVKPGAHTITVRAIDSEGNIQPAADDPLIATKVTYWESNGQITRTVEIPG